MRAKTTHGQCTKIPANGSDRSVGLGLMFADPRWRGPVLENTHGVAKLYLKCLGVSSYDDQRQKALIACNKMDENEQRRLPDWQFLVIRTDGKRILFRSDYTKANVQAVGESEWLCVQKANDFRAGPRKVDEQSKPNMFREWPQKVNFTLPSAPTANTDQVPYWYSRSAVSYTHLTLPTILVV